MEEDKDEEKKVQEIIALLQKHSRRNKALLTSLEETIHCAFGRKAKETVKSLVTNQMN
jgi:hypothetical protein